MEIPKVQWLVDESELQPSCNSFCLIIKEIYDTEKQNNPIKKWAKT